MTRGAGDTVLNEQQLQIFAAGKINRFPRKLARLFRGELVEPISTEFHLSQACNHRCPECFGQFEEKEVGNDLMDFETFRRIHDELCSIDLGDEEHEKGISFSGATGDPMLNPEYPEILEYAKLPFIFLTNGNGKVVSPALVKATGLRISLDAVDDDSHLRTHGVKGRFDAICDNVRRMVAYKKQQQADGCSLGLGFLTGEWPARPPQFPESYQFMEAEMREAIELGARLSVDYVQFRPLHDDLTDFAALRARLESERFPIKVLFSTKYDYMNHPAVPKFFPTCEANAVLCFIASNLDVYTCCHLVGLPEACIGNLGRQSLHEVLTSDRRREVLASYPNAKDCPPVCRGHMMNANCAAIRAGVGKAERQGPLGPHDVFL